MYKNFSDNIQYNSSQISDKFINKIIIEKEIDPYQAFVELYSYKHKESLTSISNYNKNISSQNIKTNNNLYLISIEKLFNSWSFYITDIRMLIKFFEFYLEVYDLNIKYNKNDKKSYFYFSKISINRKFIYSNLMLITENNLNEELIFNLFQSIKDNINQIRYEKDYFDHRILKVIVNLLKCSNYILFEKIINNVEVKEIIQIIFNNRSINNVILSDSFLFYILGRLGKSNSYISEKNMYKLANIIYSNSENRITRLFKYGSNLFNLNNFKYTDNNKDNKLDSNYHNKNYILNDFDKNIKSENSNNISFKNKLNTQKIFQTIVVAYASVNNNSIPINNESLIKLRNIKIDNISLYVYSYKYFKQNIDNLEYYLDLYLSNILKQELNSIKNYNFLINYRIKERLLILEACLHNLSYSKKYPVIKNIIDIELAFIIEYKKDLILEDILIFLNLICTDNFLINYSLDLIKYEFDFFIHELLNFDPHINLRFISNEDISIIESCLNLKNCSFDNNTNINPDNYSKDVSKFIFNYSDLFSKFLTNSLFIDFINFNNNNINLILKFSQSLQLLVLNDYTYKSLNNIKINFLDLFNLLINFNYVYYSMNLNGFINIKLKDIFDSDIYKNENFDIKQYDKINYKNINKDNNHPFLLVYKYLSNLAFNKLKENYSDKNRENYLVDKLNITYKNHYITLFDNIDCDFNDEECQSSINDKIEYIIKKLNFKYTLNYIYADCLNNLFSFIKSFYNKSQDNYCSKELTDKFSNILNTKVKYIFTISAIQPNKSNLREFSECVNIDDNTVIEYNETHRCSLMLITNLIHFIYNNNDIDFEFKKETIKNLLSNIYKDILDKFSNVEDNKRRYLEIEFIKHFVNTIKTIHN